MPLPDDHVGDWLRRAQDTLGRPLAAADLLRVVRWAETCVSDEPVVADHMAASLGGLTVKTTPSWTRFVHGAAGLLANTPDEWRLLVALGPVVEKATQPPPPPPPPPRRWPWLAALAVLVAIIVAAGWWAAQVPLQLSVPPVPAAVPDPTVESVPPPPPPPGGLTLLQPERTVDRTLPQAPRPRDLAAPFALAGLGLAFVILALLARRTTRQRVEKQEEAAHNAREGADLTLPPPAPASAFPVMSDQVLLETSTLLGSLAATHPGEALDGVATALRSARAGGRFTPWFVPRRPQASLTVLLDQELDGHLWLPAFHRLLADWQARGVRLRVYTFAQSPTELRRLTGGPSIALTTLATQVKQAPGEHPRPLLVLSRLLSDRGPGEQILTWPKDLAAWPRRAWIDPTPGRVDKRRRLLADRAKLAVFPLNDEGLRATAQYLVGQDPRPVPRPMLPAPDEVALKKWAQAAATVPDATWDQVERIRRRFPEIHRTYSERWHQVALVAWVEETEGGTERGHGDRLRPARPVVNGWLADLQATDPDFARAVREMLLEELLHRLEYLKPGTLEYEITRVRVLRQRLFIELDAALLTELEGMLTGPAGPEARIVLRDLQQSRRLERAEAGEQAVVEQIQTLAGWRRVVLPRPALVWGLLGTAAALALGWAIGQTWPVQPPPTGERVQELAIFQVTAPQNAPDQQGATDFRPELRRIPAGTFVMGSPVGEEGRSGDEEQHRVTLTRPFWLGKTEVTQGQWTAVMGRNPAYFQGERTGGPDFPVEKVSWFDAVVYLNRLSEKEGLPACYTLAGCQGEPGTGTCNDGGDLFCIGDYTCDRVDFVGLDCAGYRLPTEAEWEYAARAGTTAAIYEGEWQLVGGDAPVLDPLAWYLGNSEGSTHPVGRKRPNAWGLHDMLGNVWEWTQDAHTDALVDATDPLQAGDSAAARRVNRGCGWRNNARYCRAAYRNHSEPAGRGDSLGLRPARSSLVP